jgi:hypothetical protein
MRERSRTAPTPRSGGGQASLSAWSYLGDARLLEGARRGRGEPGDYRDRHLTGDWGDLSTDDIAENESSLRNGLRIMSRYVLSTAQPLWIITEADRSVTTFLLPEEY